MIGIAADEDRYPAYAIRLWISLCIVRGRVRVLAHTVGHAG
jgi:hypothetical protein